MPHRRISSAVAVVAAAATLAVLAAPAAAAPPPNDTIDTATQITAFPFSDPRIAITEAGTEPFDEQLALACTDGAAEHTIWYRFEATEEGLLQVISTTKGWESVVAISRGVPVDGESFNCGTGGYVQEVEPGQTYYIAVYARNVGIATGTLSVRANFYPKSVFTTIDSVSLTPGGSIAVSGTYTCSAKKPFGFVSVRIAANTHNENGAQLDGVRCTGAPQPYSIEVAPFKGSWRGTLAIEADTFVCGAVGCEDEAVGTTFTVPK